MHEASLYDQNCFVTLTYDDEHLPESGSLDRQAFPLFMKRLRKSIEPAKVRYFHCGEYGERSGRPHYHALLFGHDFVDKAPVVNGKEYPEWSSVELERLWPFGRSLLGTVNFESAAYVARYCTKKVTGAFADFVYGDLEPEYATMSRRPAIGRGWFEQFADDVFPSDEVIARGHPSKPPRRYMEMLAEGDPLMHWMVQRKRQEEFRPESATEERLEAGEKILRARMNLHSREVL